MAITTALVLAGVAAAAGVASGIQAGNAAESQANAQANQLQAQANADRYNAEIAGQNAGVVAGQTEAQLDRADRERRLRMGTARAAGGASGIGLENFGDILQSSAAQEELNLLTIQSEGALREREFTTGASLLNTSAQNSINQISGVKAAGKASKTAAILGGVSKGLGSFSGMGSSGGAPSETIKWNGPRQGGSF